MDKDGDAATGIGGGRRERAAGGTAECAVRVARRAAVYDAARPGGIARAEEVRPMPSRSVRKRLHKRLARLAGLDEAARRAEGRWYLSRWRAEARARADDLGEPAVWALEAAARPKALALDPTGELAADLSRTCAEAVAAAAGRNLVGGSRPAADRARVRHAP